MATLALYTDRKAGLRQALKQLLAAAPHEDGRPGRPVFLNLSDDIDALLDMLAFIGLLERDEDLATISSVQAGYALHLLLKLLEHEAPLIRDWGRTRLTAPGELLARLPGHVLPTGLLHPLGVGTDFVAALQLRLLELDPQHPPLRELKLALALVRWRDYDQRYYLLKRDADGLWVLPGGSFHFQDGDLRQTLLRTLALTLGEDSLRLAGSLALAPLGPCYEQVGLAPGLGLLTRSHTQLFRASLNHKPALHNGLRLVRQGELLAGTTADGQRIDISPLLALAEERDLKLSQLLEHS